MLCCDYVRASPIEAVYVNIIIIMLYCDYVRASPIEAVYVNIIIIIIQERQILGDVLITESCCKTLTRHQPGTQGWAAKRGEISKTSKYGAPAS